MTVVTTGLFAGAPRPPTPPRDHTNNIKDALDILKVDYSLDPPAETTESGLHTPADSSPVADGSNRSKKVGFKYYTVEHAGPSPQRDTDRLRPLPQTRKAKPLRSILKPRSLDTPSSEADDPFLSSASPREEQSFAKMLDSVLQLLSSSDPVMRLDGYQTLNGALKAHNDFPSEEALRAKLPQLLPAILRDIKSENTGTYHTNMCTQALKLSISLTHLVQLGSGLTNDFRASLLDCALSVFAQPSPNKAIANHFLYLLASPGFRTRSLTPAKADVLLSRLQDIQDRVSGNSVVASRLVIYQRLIEQLPAAMQQKLSLWVEHIFHGCLSNNVDVCKRAIECGMKAAVTYGTQHSATKTVVDIFTSETDEYGDYGKFFAARLMDLTRDDKRSSLIPQIWSVIILFFRYPRKPISHWLPLKPLLMPMQHCLNSSDTQTRFEAMVAWTRLVYVAGLHTIDTKDKFIVMLRTPFTTAFKVRCGHDKATLESRRAAMFGYVTLLYYALQPEQSPERLDFFWDQYVAHPQLVPAMLKHGGRDARFAMRVLKTLLRDGSRYWTADRATSQQPMQAEELQKLDPRWIRSRLPRLLELVDDYVGLSLRVVSRQSDPLENPVELLAQCIAEAAAQEVRTSVETREAIANLMNALGRYCNTANAQQDKAQVGIFVRQFAILARTIINTLGTRCVLEESLAMTNGNIVEVAPTPSSNPARHQAQTPFGYIWSLMLSFDCDPVELVDQIRSVFLEPILNLQQTSHAKLNLLKQCMLLTSNRSDQRVPQLSSKLSAMLLDVTNELRRSEESDKEELARSAGPVISILATAWTSQETETLDEHWWDLLETLRTQMYNATFSAGVYIAVTWPLLEALEVHSKALPANNRASVVAALLSMVTWSVSRAGIEKGWKTFRSQPLDPSKAASLTVLWRKIVEAADTTLLDQYSSLKQNLSQTTQLLDTLRTIIEKCPLSEIQDCICIMSHGVGVFLEDKSAVLSGMSPIVIMLRESLLALWSAVGSRLRASAIDTLDIVKTADILTAAFTSRHRRIVNDAIEIWNATYAQRTSLQYPSQLHAVLLSLQRHVEIELPASSIEMTASVDAAVLTVRLPAFELQSSSQIEEEARQVGLRSITPARDLPARAHPSGIKDHTPGKTPRTQQKLATSSVSRTPQSKAMPLPKLRHENSQIEFVNIDDLPSEVTEDGSQGLTENQKEVRLRQQADAAAIFPQFSSSPAPPSSKKNLLVTRMDEMLQREESGTRLRTPEPEMDVDGPMDAFLGSSPAARSAQRAERRSSQASSALPEAEDAADDLMEDIPSSPPELVDDDQLHLVGDDAEEDGESDTVPATNVKDEVANASQEGGNTSASVANDRAVRQIDDSEGSRKHSGVLDSQDPELVKSGDFGEGAIELLEGTGKQKGESQAATGHEAVNDQLATSQCSTPTHVNDLSVVEDSFVGVNDNDTNLVEGNDAKVRATPVPISRGRKRKSAEGVEDTPSKRAKTSPLRNFFSFDWIKSHSFTTPAEDDDIEDCIVVNTQPKRRGPDELVSEPLQAESPPALPSLPQKRKPGRPKRSDNPRMAVARSSALQKSAVHKAMAQPRRSTRRASSIVSESVVSDAQGEDSRDSISIQSSVASPSRTRARKRKQESEILSDGYVELLPQPEIVIEAGTSEQTSTATPPPTEVAEGEAHDVDNEISPEKQLQQEAAAAAAQRRLAERSPATIMGRLRSILDDVREMGRKFVLGAQEERELASMIWELGGEVHAAGQRRL